MSTIKKGVQLCSPAENSQPASNVPCTCRVCGGTLDAQFQSDGKSATTGYYIVTCWNKVCGLYTVTRSAQTYPTFDLSLYIKEVPLSTEARS